MSRIYSDINLVLSLVLSLFREMEAMLPTKWNLKILNEEGTNTELCTQTEKAKLFIQASQGMRSLGPLICLLPNLCQQEVDFK